MGGEDLKKSKNYNSISNRLSKQTDSQLLRSVNSFEKKLAEHQEKINDPSLYVQDWDSRNSWYKAGIVEKWRKEMENFETEIKIGKKIAKERGLM